MTKFYHKKRKKKRKQRLLISEDYNYSILEIKGAGNGGLRGMGFEDEWKE